MEPTTTPTAPAPGTHRLLIKNMVCPQCIRAVREDLTALGLRVTQVALGVADVATPTGAEPDHLQARVITENDVDVWAQVTGTMTGPGGKFTYSAMTSMRLFVRQEVVFQGETGLIRVTAPFNTNVFGVARLEWHSEGLTMREERWPADNHYVLQVEAFCRSVTTGVPYACSLEFVRGTQAMIDQVFAVAVPA